MHRKITTLLLLFIFLINAFGYLKVYQFMYEKNPRAVRVVPSKQKDLLKVVSRKGLLEMRKKGFRRVEEGEYLYKGHRYDVVKTIKKNAQVVIYLKHDSYEEKLLSFLKSFFSPASANQQDHTTAKLKHDLLKQYLPSATPLLAALAGTKKKAALYAIHSPQIPYLEILVPPPRFIA